MSTLRVNTLQNAAGTGQPAMSGAAKAWVNFNGTGTVAIRASFNVTSITDNGTGDYTVNFTNALEDANYTAVCSTSGNGGNNSVVVLPFTSGTSQITPTTTQLRLATVQAVTAIIDSPYIQVTIFR